MSELSAKHKALNVLRVLSAGRGHRPAQTSPSPDLTGSQEVLAVKYRELATILATQHVEHQTVSRLHSLDLVSRSAGCIPLRRQRIHDSQVRPIRRRYRKPTVPKDGQTPKVVELNSSNTERKDASELHLNLEHLSTSSSNKKKNVSFCDVKLVRGIDDGSSSSTDMSDTELIRRILQSPRKVLVNKHPIHSMRATSHAVSPNKQTRKHKKKLCKVKNTPKETSNQSKRSSSLGSPTMTMTPREKKEFHPTDNKLSSSNNPDVLCWLKEKNKRIRKQKRMERKKERQEKAAEQKVMEEKQKRLAESEDKFNQWMKHKKDESQRRQQIEKKVRKNAAKRGTSEWTEVSEGKTDHSPAKHRGIRFDIQIKKRTTNSRKEIKIHKSVSSLKESVADNQRHSDEEARHQVVQNLEAERLQAEEKRQKKEAEKRRRQLFREAQHGSTNNSDSKSGTDEKSNDKTSSAAKPTPDTNSQPSACYTASIRKTMPSSNPFKGLTYDEWLKQKQADQRRQAKEAKTQEGGDPELDDFIPQLARRRIEQIKARATRVDSGLRRSQNSSDADKTDKSRTPNGVRPYTWTTTSSTPSDKHHKISRPSPPKNRKSIRTTKSSTAMPDVISFERPEPQGCERTEEITCQSPKPEQSKDANLNKEPILNKFKDLAVNENNQSRNEQLMSNMQASKGDTIFMTEPQTFKEVT